MKVKAAELLGMSFRSFRYYTKKYNLAVTPAARLTNNWHSGQELS